MKRNAITGEYTFNSEEVNTISLAINSRCEDTLQQYRVAVKYSPIGIAEYFAKEYNAACAIYKELYNKDFPATTDDGPVPDTTADSADC